MRANNIFKCILIVFLIASIFYRWPVLASSVDDLRNKINENKNQIAELEKEIAQLQEQLTKTTGETKTLKTQIFQLENTIKKLKTDIILTEKKITNANLIIQELNFGIKDKEEKIGDSKRTIAEIIRSIDEEESQSLIEIILARSNFSEFFSDVERMKNLQEDVKTNLEKLRVLKNDLQDKENKKEVEKKSLQNLQSSLSDQKKIVESQKTQKNTVLKETQNKESNYKKLLEERLARQQELENEISVIEEKIRIEIDPSSLPKTGSGVLLWPLDKSFVTQYFGNTSFATQNPQVYGGKGHNGIDLRASVGMPVKSSENGVITAVGSIVSYCRGYQIGYGKWVLIRHENSLSTFYAHLSLIKVSPGEKVERGQLIGYSGDTGFSTGPHLHFGVFATKAISSLEYTSTSKTCGGILMRQPIVSPSGYLNPLSYL